MKTLLFLTIFASMNLYAQVEDAAILNDEMDFLRSSAKEVKVSVAEKKQIKIKRTASESEASDGQIVDIENKYFTDQVPTKKAAVKRRARSFGTGVAPTTTGTIFQD